MKTNIKYKILKIIAISIGVSLVFLTKSFLVGISVGAISVYLVNCKKDMDLENLKEKFTNSINDNIFDKEYDNTLKTKENFVTKEEIDLNVVRKMLNIKRAYNLPAFKLSNKDIKILFDTIFNYLQDKGKIEDYYNFLNELYACTFANVIVDNEKEITITDFINNIYSLQYLGYSEKEALELQKRLILEFKEDYKSNVDEDGFTRQLHKN